MKDLDKKLAGIVQEMNNTEEDLHQIKQFDESLKRLGLAENSRKSTYTYPLVDTIGRNTYSLLNKK